MLKRAWATCSGGQPSGQHRHRAFSSQQKVLLGSTASCGVRAAAPLRPVGAERGRANTVINTRRRQLLLSPSSCYLLGAALETGPLSLLPVLQGSNTTPSNDKEAESSVVSRPASDPGGEDSPGSGAGFRGPCKSARSQEEQPL